jgi:hypothetical protein
MLLAALAKPPDLLNNDYLSFLHDDQYRTQGCLEQNPPIAGAGLIASTVSLISSLSAACNQIDASWLRARGNQWT